VPRRAPRNPSARALTARPSPRPAQAAAVAAAEARPASRPAGRADRSRAAQRRADRSQAALNRAVRSRAALKQAVRGQAALNRAVRSPADRSRAARSRAAKGAAVDNYATLTQGRPGTRNVSALDGAQLGFCGGCAPFKVELPGVGACRSNAFATKPPKETCRINV
jgi:hypothetical protein